MSGNNAAGARCRETQPVVMSYAPQGPKRMQVHVVPRGGADEPGALPPAPGDAAVRLAVAGGEVLAARQFEGNATKEACEACRAALAAALQRDGPGPCRGRGRWRLPACAVRPAAQPADAGERDLAGSQALIQ
ncbi:hypothetical protein ABPG77_004448 [Micractinium sp. CCAP 211/92]